MQVVVVFYTANRDDYGMYEGMDCTSVAGEEFPIAIPLCDA